ncbi:MAG: hypothetical protein JKX92_15510 [Porticoccaceae bacterium]|nr:hypothetical protein [Porticoccaceae bacterium]
MKKHIGSSIALVIGVLGLLSGLAKPGSILFTGVVIILGALAYRSAKKRFLGEVKSTVIRKTIEVIAIVIAMASVLLQNNLLKAIELDPVPNLIIPLWVLIAYIVIFIRNPSQADESNIE